jgi:hypothetical protein
MEGIYNHSDARRRNVSARKGLEKMSKADSYFENQRHRRKMFGLPLISQRDCGSRSKQRLIKLIPNKSEVDFRNFIPDNSICIGGGYINVGDIICPKCYEAFREVLIKKIKAEK